MTAYPRSEMSSAVATRRGEKPSRLARITRSTTSSKRGSSLSARSLAFVISRRPRRRRADVGGSVRDVCAPRHTTREACKAVTTSRCCLTMSCVSGALRRSAAASARVSRGPTASIVSPVKEVSATGVTLEAVGRLRSTSAPFRCTWAASRVATVVPPPPSCLRSTGSTRPVSRRTWRVGTESALPSDGLGHMRGRARLRSSTGWAQGSPRLVAQP